MQAGRGRSWQLTGDRPVPWLTYQQIGERFGLGTEAARTRVRRAGWRTQPGNDGRTLALVPDDAELRPAGDRASGPAGDRETDRDETALTDLLTGALTALEDAVSVLREQLDAANARADAERARADRSDAAVAGERSRSDVLRSRLDEMIEARAEADRAIAEERLRADAAHTTAHAAQQAAEELRRADEARKARGLLAQLRSAWRGE